MPREVERPYDARLAKALAHPLRAQILDRLDRHTASPSELADELDAPLGNVSYHVRILAEAGLIELVRTTRRRGATEHHYRAAPEPPAGQLGLMQIPATPRAAQTSRRSAVSRKKDQTMRSEPAPTRSRGEAASERRRDPLRDTVEELRGRVRASDRNRNAPSAAHITRTPLVLDDVAWEELHTAVERLHDLALRLQVESAPRLRRGQHANEREANLVLMFFDSSDLAPARVLRGGDGDRRGSSGRAGPD